jgi:hypothetical protein
MLSSERLSEKGECEGIAPQIITSRRLPAAGYPKESSTRLLTKSAPESITSTGQVSSWLVYDEMLDTKYAFGDPIELQAVDIAQPDLCLTGGLWEMRRLAVFHLGVGEPA